VDDLDSFLESLTRGEPLVALVAPSVVSSFPGQWLQLNGWLRSAGVSAVFDVSFGAELTVQNYVKHIREQKPECLIASPCPAVVSYISIYQPELIPFVAPYDSPIGHTLKVIKSSYPQYAGHRTVIISPCPAKKREYVQSGLGDFNVNLSGLDAYLREQGVDLASFEPADFIQPPAQDGSVFSSPGGLLFNVEKHLPGIAPQSRKVEGVDVYEYLRELPKALERGCAPKLVDCLSCKKGCNGGPGSVASDVPLDELEHAISKRHAAAAKRSSIKRLRPFLDGISYHREIHDLSQKNQIKEPTDEEVAGIYTTMLKETDADVLNCAACGYSNCRTMAKAIFNGLNRVENCHKYLQKMMRQEHARSLADHFLFSELFKFTHDAILIADDASIIECNSSACALFGYERYELVGRPLNWIFQDIKLDHATVSVRGKEVRRECLLMRSDGVPFDADVRMSAFNLNDKEVYQIHVRDVSFTTHARHQLEEGHAYINTLFESIEVGIIVVRCADRRIMDINGYALRLIGLSKEAVVGEVCQCFVCPASKGQCPVMDLGENIDTDERVLLNAKGEKIPILKTIVKTKLGGADCLVESFVDLSSKKQTEAALRSARDDAERASRAKTEFLANMSHEIRTPMNGVLGLADLLMDTNLTVDQLPLVRDIIFSADSLLAVINNILDISRIEASELRLDLVKFDLVALVSDTLRLMEPLAAKRGNELRIRYESDFPPMLKGDPVRFRQVLVNLLGNAVKFTKDGLVELVLHGVPEGSSEYRVNVWVRDGGIGIPADKIGLIFDKFSQADSSTTRKYGGTGLGLPITRELVRLMGGEIEVTSQMGEGSEFSCYMRLEAVSDEAKTLETAEELHHMAADFGHVSLLLVEDNRVNRVVFSRMLERFGCQITTAENGQEAVDLLEKSSFDLVLMDCSMPVMDGFEATLEIRSRLKLAVPIVAITAHAMQGDDARCYAAGMNGYLTKPMKRGQLAAVLNEYCAQRPVEI
jgi:PAS domain S-box-containing protein